METKIDIVYSQEFENSDYTDDGASVRGRMEAIINEIEPLADYRIVAPHKADTSDIIEVHTEEYIATIKANSKLYDMAMLSAGSAIRASEIGIGGNPAMSVARPPGHHAYRSSGWGYCHFCNMAVALKRLRKQGRINSAFVLDFDAHTGDGTIDCLKDWKEVKILNPMADNAEEYLKRIDEYIKDLPEVDIIGVCAGFDSYVLDVGRKLSTFDFYLIGRKIKQLSARISNNKRFAILEGGYYLPDLGKNVVSFCDGFKNGVF